MHDFDLTFLSRLVNINSQTQNMAGVTEAQKLLAHEFSQLGMQLQWYAHPDGEYADALVASIGDGPFRLTLLGHVDTVARGGDFFPFEKIENGKIRGAGIADMKAGVAIILEALKTVVSVLNEQVTLRVVISPNEEVGSPGFHDLFSDIGEDSDLVLCFEPALPDGSFIGGRNGNRWYDFTFSGDKLHTGRAPKGSNNILHQICELQRVMSEHAADDEGLKFNLTSIETDNDKHNVTSSEATVKMDLRFGELMQREEFHQTLLHWRKKKEIPFQYAIADDCPPLSNIQGEEIIQTLKEELISAEGKKLSCRHCEGASDANYFSTPGNVVLDGLGPEGAYFHSRKEYIIEASLSRRTKGLTRFLKNLLNEKGLRELDLSSEPA